MPNLNPVIVCYSGISSRVSGITRYIDIFIPNPDPEHDFCGYWIPDTRWISGRVCNFTKPATCFDIPKSNDEDFYKHIKILNIRKNKT